MKTLPTLKGWPRSCLLFCLLILYAQVNLRAAAAHAGEPPAPHDLWQAWNGDPWLIAAGMLSGYLYARGVYAVWCKAGVGRGVTRRQVGWFSLGLFTLFVALISPLDALSDALFSAHMVQHLLLLYVAPLCCVLGVPSVLFMWTLPQPWRRPLSHWWRQGSWSQLGHRLWHFVLNPFTIWSVFGITLWLWHAPLLYQAAVLHHWIHVLEHLTFFSTSLLFCWLLVYAGRGRHTGYGTILFILFTTALHSGLLGALLTFATTPLYPIYAASARTWGISLLVDQQLAGVVMWIPIGFFYLATVLILLARWLRTMETASSAPATGLPHPQE